MKLNVTGSEYVLPLFGYPVYSSKELYSFTEEEYNNLKNEETEGIHLLRIAIRQKVLF